MLFNFVIAFAVGFSFAYGGHHHHGDAEFLHKSPAAIEDRETVKSCADGFKPHGKQCIKFVRTEPIAHCPSGFEPFVGRLNECVQYFQKEFECPKDTFQQNGLCIHTIAIEPMIECPDGFKLKDNHQCIRHLASPNRFFCPPETFKRDGVCIRRVAVQPEFHCEKGFAFTDDRRCKQVETFDCTPVSHHEDAVESSHKHHHHLRILGAKDKKHSTVTSKEGPTQEKQFVVQKTCKRVRVVSAHKVCPGDSTHHNKECFIDEEIPMQEQVSHKFIEDVVKARIICPEAHVRSAVHGHVQCLFREEVKPRRFCPHSTESIDNKCARFAPVLLVCPHGHILEENECLKKIIAAPIFQCVGKDCDQGHHHHKHHK